MNPWIEKYRPNVLVDVILDPTYVIMFDTMINTLFMPHLLFYGPPGTGKTTTINCLLTRIKLKYNMNNNILHLNASDDRGVDVVRNIIYNFVHSNGIFTNSSLKFVVLDEVDSMTKLAQQSLISLLSNYTNVRFCLICNYISKIIPTLRYKCLTLNFFNSPNYKSYINRIIKMENINITPKVVSNIIYNYYPDIRCMVNALQVYNYMKCDFINEASIQSLCNKYSYLKLKTYLKKFNFKDFMTKIYMHFISNYKFDSTLITYMKNSIMNDPCIEYVDQIIFPYFFLLQN